MKSLHCGLGSEKVDGHTPVGFTSEEIARTIALILNPRLMGNPQFKCRGGRSAEMDCRIGVHRIADLAAKIGSSHLPPKSALC